MDFECIVLRLPVWIICGWLSQWLVVLSLETLNPITQGINNPASARSLLDPALGSPFHPIWVILNPVDFRVEMPECPPFLKKTKNTNNTARQAQRRFHLELCDWSTLTFCKKPNHVVLFLLFLLHPNGCNGNGH